MDKIDTSASLLFFDSFEESDRHNRDYYRNLTDVQRLDIALELMRPYYEAYPRLERVYRTAELGECPVSRDRWMGDK